MELTVLDYVIDVEMVNPEMWNQTDYGLCSLAHQMVRIREGMGREMTLSTLFHELMHIGTEIQGQALSEEHIDAAALTMFSILENNLDKIVEIMNLKRDDESAE